MHRAQGAAESPNGVLLFLPSPFRIARALVARQLGTPLEDMSIS